jgi:thiamine biosynthesis protein ThiI
LNADLNCIIDSDWGRIYIQTSDEKVGIGLLTKIFGISSISPVISINDELEEITKTVLEFSKGLLSTGQSFALRTRRTGKHPFTSMELAQHLGKEILDNFKNKKLKVNLTSPDVELFVEVRNRHTYIFSESFAGPGGLPLGTQGKIVSVFNDKNSYIATWLMMKRGCRTYPVFFDFENESDPTSKCNTITRQEALSQIEHLKPWAPNIKLKVIKHNSVPVDNFTDLLRTDPTFREFVRWTQAKGICQGYDLQAFTNCNRKSTLDMPIFYPCIGLDDVQLNAINEHILKQ